MTLKLFFYIVVLLIAIFGYRSYSSTSNKLKIGDDAPKFTLKDAQGNTHHLSDYAGSYLILYFYPKDDTPSCTKEACNFRDDFTQLEKLHAKIIGISLDSAKSHAEFTNKHHLPFPLLTDTNAKVAESYHALMDFYVFKIAKRHTFLINPAGKIEQIYRSVDSTKHSQQIIDDLKNIQSSM